jgi:hypothetical protein
MSEGPGGSVDLRVPAWDRSSATRKASAEMVRSQPVAFGTGALIGTLGGLIGLGGAKFRLPLLISLFRFLLFGADIRLAVASHWR